MYNLLCKSFVQILQSFFMDLLRNGRVERSPPGSASLTHHSPPTPNHDSRNDDVASGVAPELGEPDGAALANASLASASVAGSQMLRLQQQLNRLQRTVRLTMEAEFLLFFGKSFGSLAANQEVVAMIQDVLESHGLRVRCPECGHPAILRCSARPGVASGVFVLDHTIEGRRTFHGGTSTVPELKLLAKPPRRTAKQAS